MTNHDEELERLRTKYAITPRKLTVNETLYSQSPEIEKIRRWWESHYIDANNGRTLMEHASRVLMKQGLMLKFRSLETS